MDEGKQVDVIYIDFEKAFDRVNHNILLEKLNHYHFSPTVIRLLYSYLTNRKQSVVYKEYKSYEYSALSGVPQGSNLGPLLFLLFVNDLPDCVSDNEKLLFADDFKIYTKVNSIGDCIRLQQSLDNIANWCAINQLGVNISKCKVLSFNRNKTTHQFDYSINKIVLNRPTVVKDLGVSFDSKLTFNIHVTNITNEALKLLGFVIRTGREFNNISTLEKIYYAYVRSKVEYASSIWNPYQLKHCQQLEKIQSKFLKFLTFKETRIYPAYDSYNAVIKNFNIQSLEQRRNIADLLFLQKIVQNKLDCMDLVSTLQFRVPSSKTRVNNTGLFHCKKARTNILMRSPIWRICTIYNQLCTVHNDLDVCYMSPKEFRDAIVNKVCTTTL